MAVNPWFRLLIYGMLGFSYEIVFTSIFDFVALISPISLSKELFSLVFSYLWVVQFLWRTSIRLLKKASIDLSARVNLCPIGLQVGIYRRPHSRSIFSTYVGLQPLYKYDVMGLIALEYAPLWFCSGLLKEFFYEYLLTLSMPPAVKSMEVNGNDILREKERSLQDGLKRRTCEL